MSEDLKLSPCPFCGSEEVNLLYTSEINGEAYCIDNEEELNDTYILAYIHCYNCDIDFMSDAGSPTPKDVLKAWNSRA